MRLMSQAATSHRSGLIRAALLQGPNTPTGKWLQPHGCSCLQGRGEKDEKEADGSHKPDTESSQNKTYCSLLFWRYGSSFKKVAQQNCKDACFPFFLSVIFVCCECVVKKKNTTSWASTQWMNGLKRLLFVVQFCPSEPKDTKGGTRTKHTERSLLFPLTYLCLHLFFQDTENKNRDSIFLITNLIYRANLWPGYTVHKEPKQRIFKLKICHLRISHLRLSRSVVILK